jgi:hypothetical protein
VLTRHGRDTPSPLMQCLSQWLWLVHYVQRSGMQRIHRHGASKPLTAPQILPAGP